MKRIIVIVPSYYTEIQPKKVLKKIHWTSEPTYWVRNISSVISDRKVWLMRQMGSHRRAVLSVETAETLSRSVAYENSTQPVITVY